ncbi:DNase I-like protein, partial [Exidia glandulosa HHB12029]
MSEIETFYKDLHVINTPHPDNPAGAGGVAIILNKRLTNTENLETHVLVPGRAILTTMNWHRGDELTILAVYGPNEKSENHDMWSDIENKIRDSNGTIPKPDILLGDFNFVEDAIDRFPAKMNDADGPDTFDSLKQYLRLTDGWRETFPTSTEYTWRSPSRDKLSRIDRIYMTRALTLASRQWGIELTDLNRHDHSRISTEIVNLDAPFIGPGRWTMRANLADDEEFLAAVDVIGKHALERLQRLGDARDENENAQTIYREFKTAVIRTAKRHQREINCRLNSKLTKLENDRKEA